MGALLGIRRLEEFILFFVFLLNLVHIDVLHNIHVNILHAV